jgi:hypothetical protein
MSANDDVNPRPALSFHPERMVTLLVGPKKQEMSAHADYLCRDSVWFKTRLRGSESRVVNLEKESPVLVQYYIEHVVHGGRLPTHNVNAGPPTSINHADHLLLAGLYVVGETFLNAKYQNKILQEFLRLTTLQYGPSLRRFYPTRECVNVIYRGTATDSPARRMMVDFATGSGGETWLEYPNPDPRYLQDVAKAYMQKTNAQETVRDFRDVHMTAEDYVVYEYPPPQHIPGM